MKIVGSYLEYLQLNQYIQNQVSRPYTNIFWNIKKVKDFIKNGSLFYEKDGNTIVYFVKEEKFYRLYYYSDSDIFISGFNINHFQTNMPIVLDILVSNEMIDINRFENKGFRLYKTYKRMCYINHDHFQGEIKSEFAKNKDAGNISNLLNTKFDMFTDYIPSLFNVKKSISNKQIIVEKNVGEVVAFLMMTKQGLSSNLNYWFVLDKYKGKGLGSRLLKTYHALNNETKRFTLWVDLNNKNAINKYKYYHYYFDGLIDYIFLNDGRNN